MSTSQFVAPSLCEGDVLAESEWRERLGIGDAQFRALATDGILRRSGGSGSVTAYRLDFVGLLFTRDQAFTVLPKIFRASIDPSVARDVIACIRVYLGRLKRRLRHAETSEILSARDGGGQTVDVLLSLIDWTLDRGFHSEDFEERSDESFDIDWTATMDHAVPVHVGRSVVYSEVVGRHASYQLGPLAHLQASALFELHGKLGPTSFLWLDEHDPLLERAKEILDESATGEASFVANLDELADFLSVCNRDHDRELAGILFDWMTGRRRAAELPYSFGTTAFQYVWEDMCEVAASGLGESLSHKEIASQPGYRIGETIWNAEGQRPDILRQLDNGVCILDAKWYDVLNREWPGTHDVIKQIMYQSTIAETHRVQFNGFLVPVRQQSPEPEFIGEAKLMFAEQADPRFPAVRVIAIPWQAAVAAYCGLSLDGRIANAVLRASGSAQKD